MADQVDLSAMTDRSPYHPGVQSIGTRTGVSIAQQGTSSAAPQVARALAQCFLADRHIGPTTDNYLSCLAQHPVCAQIVDPGRAPNILDRLGHYRLAPPPQR